MLKRFAVAVFVLIILALAPVVDASAGDQIRAPAQAQQQPDRQNVELLPPFQPVTLAGQVLLGAVPLVVVPLGIEYSQTLGIESIYKAPVGGMLLALSAMAVPITVESVGTATGYASNKRGTLLGAVAGFTLGAFSSAVVAGVSDGFGWHESPNLFVAPIAVGLLGGSILGFHLHAGSQYRIQQAKRAHVTPSVMPMTPLSERETGVGFGFQGRF